MSDAGEATTADKPSLRQILEKAGASAVRGGTAGAVAMGMNVGLLMWMRTTVRFPVCVHFGVRRPEWPMRDCPGRRTRDSYFMPRVVYPIDR